MPEPDNRCAVNEFSMGIELTASAVSGFTPSQYEQLALVCADIERRRGRRFTYVGHEQIAGQRAVRLGLRQDSKTDPGPAFEWRVFFKLIDVERESGSSALRD